MIKIFKVRILTDSKLLKCKKVSKKESKKRVDKKVRKIKASKKEKIHRYRSSNSRTNLF